MTGRQPRHDSEAGAVDASLPKHPYRDSACLHLGLGMLLLVVAWLTGGDLAKAVVVAILYVVVAIGWSWYRFRQRIQRETGAEASRGAPR